MTRSPHRVERFAAAATIVLAALSACATAQKQSQPQSAAPHYLYVWAQPTDTMRPSFLGVLDLNQRERGLVRVVPVDAPSRGAHHIEYELGNDPLLFANAFTSGRTFLFDLRKADEPRVVASFGDIGPYSHPHSYARLPNGNVIATFQWQVSGALPGGLVELDRSGRPVRWASAETTETDSRQIVPYSLVVLPKLDRIVTTSTHMIEDIGVHVQIWRLSDLKLLRTLAIPIAGEHQGHAAHDTDHHRLPGEPRVVTDGHTVMFGTFTCGLYRITGLETDDPKVLFTYAFPGADCAVPVVIGKYWIQTVPALHALVALDVTDPARPIEASRLALGEQAAPHYLAADASGRRLVVTSASRKDPTLYIVDFNPANGRLSCQCDAAALDLRSVRWPDGYEGGAVPHGVVFSRQ